MEWWIFLNLIISLCFTTNDYFKCFQAKLFHVPILPQYLIAILVLGAFILLILFQTSVIGPVNYWF